MLEVCVDSLESAANAFRGGANEMELCSALSDGGLTPSAGLVREVLKLVNSHPTSERPKVNIMLRCRGGDDFVYTDQEMDTMLADLEIFKEMNVDRFVFGALTDTQLIHEDNCMKILSKAKPILVTFHRAFDLCDDPLKAVDTIVKLGFDRLLTSGQQPTVDSHQALDLIQKLVQSFGSKIQIMPGSGINKFNAIKYMDIGCSIVHSSCKICRKLPKSRNLTLGGSSDIYVTDVSVVRQLKDILNNTSIV